MKNLDFRKFCLLIISLVLISFDVLAQNGIWTKKADIPKGGGTASVVDGKIYVLGGTSLPSLTDLSYNVVYDPLTNTWEEKTQMPTARGFLTSAVVGNKIYAIGGGYPSSTNKNEVYDPATDSWATKADMLNARLGMQAAVVDGIIYIFGGNYNEHNCQAYDPGTNTWTEKTPIPEGAGGVLSVTAYNGLIYIFGGSSGWSLSVSLSKVYAYNPQTDIYTPKKDMPTSRLALQTYLVNGKIYAIGGCPDGSLTLATVEEYDPDTDSWETKPDMPRNLAWLTGAVVNNKIYIIGGTPDWGATNNYSVWEYDPYSTINTSPWKINFGNIILGNSSDTIEVTIKNNGLQAIYINSITLNQAEFSLSNLPTFPTILSSSDSIQFYALFKPSGQGIKGGEISIIYQDTLEHSIIVPLIGYGFPSSDQLLAPQFKQFVNLVNEAKPEERTAIVDSFLNEHKTMPFIEQDTICNFIFRGNAVSVNLTGDLNNWDTYGEPMLKLSTTDLYYCSKVFEPDARLEYQFVLDFNNWTLDTLNKHTFLNGYNLNSELAMPNYDYAPEISYYPEIQHGELFDTTFYSTILGNERRVCVYTPYAYQPNGTDSFEVALFNDGSGWLTCANAQNALDYLIYNKHIRPLIAVFVDPVDRDPEYVGNLQNNYAKFVATELMPFVDSRFRSQKRATSRATIGISNGGNIALWILNKYPNMFGNAASLSGSIQYQTKIDFQNKTPGSIKLYIDVGTYDLIYSSTVFLNLSRDFHNVIQTKGYNNRYNEWHEGHTWGNWGAHLDNALEFFFPGSAVDVKEEKKEIPTSFTLMQNYPNPFNPKTNFEFRIANFGLVSLKIYDVLGKEVATLVNEEKPAGTYEVTWNAANLPSGVYFYQLKAGSFTVTKKLLLLK